MGYILKEIKEQNLSFKIKVYKKNRFFSIKDRLINFFQALIIYGFHLPTAGFVILDNILLASAYFKFHPETKVVQVWHSAGVFKKFGLHACKDPKEREIIRRANQNLTHIIADSHRYTDIIAEAFGVKLDIVLPIGSPRTDFLFNQDSIRSATQSFLSKFNDIKHKKKILYAPTFREYEEYELIKLRLELEYLQKNLGQDYVILIRLHPKKKSQLKLDDKLKNYVIDVSNYENLEHLLAGVDILVTDYSSIFLEFIVLMKPIIFYPYDLEEYESKDRGFYFEYQKWVPGKVVNNISDLVKAILFAEIDKERYEAFVNQLFDHRDGQASKRFVARVLLK